MERLLLAAALCGGLAACAAQNGAPGGSSGQIVRISPSVWSAYEQYAARTYPLYFAVSADGERAGYNYCPDTRCIDEMGRGRKNVLSLCAQGGGRNCLIFAFKGDIKVQYEVRP